MTDEPTRWQQQPLVVGLVAALGLFGTALLVDVVFGSAPEWGEALPRGRLWGLAAAGLAWAAQRSPDEPEPEPAPVTASRVVFAGRLPAEADPAELRVGLLHVKQRSLAVRRWGGIGLAAVVVIALGSAVVSPSGLAWMIAVLAGVTLPFVTAVYGWRAEDAQRLLTELAARSPDAGTS